MIIEKVVGNVGESRYQNKEIDYVDLEWHEVHKKLHKKRTRGGKEIGIRLGDSVLLKGLRQGDVLYEDADSIIAVNILSCKMILVDIHGSHLHMLEMLGKVCYEIGNKHAALFWGKDYGQVQTPFSQPAIEQLQKLHGITCSVENVKPDFSKRISAGNNRHSH